MPPMKQTKSLQDQIKLNDLASSASVAKIAEKTYENQQGFAKIHQHHVALMGPRIVLRFQNRFSRFASLVLQKLLLKQYLQGFF